MIGNQQKVCCDSSVQGLHTAEQTPVAVVTVSMGYYQTHYASQKPVTALEYAWLGEDPAFGKRVFILIQ